MTLEVKKAYSTTMTRRCTAAREIQKMGTKPQKKNAHRYTCARPSLYNSILGLATRMQLAGSLQGLSGFERSVLGYGPGHGTGSDSHLCC